MSRTDADDQRPAVVPHTEATGQLLCRLWVVGAIEYDEWIYAGFLKSAGPNVSGYQVLVSGWLRGRPKWRAAARAKPAFSP